MYPPAPENGRMNHETPLTLADWAKLVVAWFGNVWAATTASITMQNLVLGATLIFTLAQLFVLWRDKIRPGRRREIDRP